MYVSYYDNMRIAAALNGAMPTINPADDFNTTVVGGAILFGGASSLFQGGTWLWSNKGNYASAWQTVKQNALNAKTPEALRVKGNLFSNPFTNKYYWQNIRELKSGITPKPVFDQTAYDALKTEAEKNAFIEKHNNLSVKNFYQSTVAQRLEKIEQLAKEGKLHGKALKNALNRADMMKYKSELNILNDLNIKPTGFLEKTGYTINKYTGMNWAKKQCLKAATKEGTSNTAKATRLAGRAGRGLIRHGGPITFLIEMGCEVPEISKTYSELGTARGTKQLAKSTFVAGSSAIGFAAGAKVGGILGAKVGTAIGAWFGGVGAVPGAIIGGIVGIGCGLLGSWGARKLAKCATGPSELEKANKSKTSTDTLLMALNKNKQIKACADLYTKAKVEGVKLDNLTVASMEKIIAGREKEFESLVQKNMQAIKNKKSLEISA